MSKEELAAEYITERNKLLKVWEAEKVQLEKYKESEMKARKAVVAFMCDPAKSSGTETVELANGFKAKVVKDLNYNVDQDAVNGALDQLENLSEEGKVIADRIIKWKGTLSVSEYKSLKPEHKAIIDTVITTSEGAPTLEIVAPKNKKQL